MMPWGPRDRGHRDVAAPALPRWSNPVHPSAYFTVPQYFSIQSTTSLIISLRGIVWDVS